KERAKDLDDFIHDGLIAAAKRCESCLKDDLGLTFVEGEDIGADEPVPSGYEASQPPSEEVSFEVSEDDITIESVGRSDEDEIEDISLDGPPREFSSDFELIEPSPLVVEPSSIDDDDDDDEVSSPEEESEAKPSFTWADYEKAVTPKKEESVIDEDEEEIEAEEEYDLDDEIETTFGLSEDESIPFDEDISLGPPKVLAPSEEPALPTDELESSYDEEIPPPADIEDLGDADMSGPITEPPPPPPPPESEEDEDERRRRARRLFFGD
ncbi:MAG: hypothetical protein ACFFE3_13920, partial [Candidatus Thorarchaeota archaeon]